MELGVVEYAQRFLTLVAGEVDLEKFYLIENCGEHDARLEGYSFCFNKDKKDSLCEYYTEGTGSNADSFRRLLELKPVKVIGIVAHTNETTYTKRVLDYYGSAEAVLNSANVLPDSITVEEADVEEETLDLDKASDFSLDFTLDDEDGDEGELFMAPIIIPEVAVPLAVVSDEDDPELPVDFNVVIEEEVPVMEFSAPVEVELPVMQKIPMLSEFSVPVEVELPEMEELPPVMEFSAPVEVELPAVEEIVEEQVVGETKIEGVDNLEHVAEEKVNVHNVEEAKLEETAEVKTQAVSEDWSYPGASGTTEVRNEKETIAVEAMEALTTLVRILPEEFANPIANVAMMILGSKGTNNLATPTELISADEYSIMLNLFKGMPPEDAARAYGYAIKRMWRDGDKEAVSKLFSEALFFIEEAI